MSDPVLSASEEKEFMRVLDKMEECSERIGALHLMGFDARWEWTSTDQLPLITVGRRTW